MYICDPLRKLKGLFGGSDQWFWVFDLSKKEQLWRDKRQLNDTFILCIHAISKEEIVPKQFADFINHVFTEAFSINYQCLNRIALLHCDPKGYHDGKGSEVTSTGARYKRYHLHIIVLNVFTNESKPSEIKLSFQWRIDDQRWKLVFFAL